MKIEILYPEICNLFADLGNIRYLKSCLEASGIPYEIVETSLKDEPLFVREKPDLVYMGTLTEKNQMIALKSLIPYRNELITKIEENTLFLITGNALEIFGHAIIDEEKNWIPCLNLFDTVAERDMFDRKNGLYWGNYIEGDLDLDIVGFKSQFTLSVPNKTNAAFFPHDALFHTKPAKGFGMNMDTLDEGICYKGFLATYIIGPLLILNPYFTEHLMRKMGIKNPTLAYKYAAVKAYVERVKEFSSPDCHFMY